MLNQKKVEIFQRKIHKALAKQFLEVDISYLNKIYGIFATQKYGNMIKEIYLKTLNQSYLKGRY